MSIDARCQEQQSAVDRILMDFKYTRPGSKEQLQALATLSFLIGMWADTYGRREKNGSSFGPRRPLSRNEGKPCSRGGLGALTHATEML